MVFSRFAASMAARSGALVLTLAALAWVATHTHWYVTIALLFAVALLEIASLARFTGTSSRALARFLDALSFDDTAQEFSGLKQQGIYHELGTAMERVMARLRAGRLEREEQTQYLQAVLAHVPVALIARDGEGHLQILNPAAKRLFGGPIAGIGDLPRFGEAFAAGLADLKTGESLLLRMERATSTLHLKVAATDFVLRGQRRTIISLQNIANELNAQEVAAWQTVIRTMAHEVMNSLTPISSLSTTAHELVHDARRSLPAGDMMAATALDDAADALETVARRSAGLLHFVQAHRRLTQHLVAQPERLALARVFARLQRLLAADLAARNIALTTMVEPETIEVMADAELLDQALINLMRNAMEALDDTARPRIELSARRGADGRVTITVADNGPGIPPLQRERIFVPFYTTKRQGTGVGLSLVRQIVALHGGNVELEHPPAGGASFNLRL